MHKLFVQRAVPEKLDRIQHRLHGEKGLYFTDTT